MRHPRAEAPDPRRRRPPEPAARPVPLKALPRRRPVVATLMFLAALVVAACGQEASTRATSEPNGFTPSESAPTSDPSPEQQTAPPAPNQPAVVGQLLTTAESAFGPMLFDGRGQAIYLFDEEDTDRPACYGECAAAWPPVLTAGPPRAAGGVRAKLLGTTERDDGSRQVTYAGHPLYYYAHEDPGQVLCHDVTDFGGRWLVVTPGGTPAP